MDVRVDVDFRFYLFIAWLQSMPFKRDVEESGCTLYYNMYNENKSAACSDVLVGSVGCIVN